MSINDNTKSDRELKNIGFLRNKKTGKYTANIIAKNGRLTALQQVCIGNASILFGDGMTKVSTSFTIEVRGIDYEKIDDFLDYISKEDLETGGIGPKLRPIVSCVGTGCRHSNIDSEDFLEKIDELIYKKYRDKELPNKFKVIISGCPNDCANTNLCDIGIIAQYIPNFKNDLCRDCKICFIEDKCPVDALSIDDKKINRDENKCNNCGRCIHKCPFKVVEEGQKGYKVFVGGKGGRIKSNAKPLDKILTSKEELFELIEKIILFYIENGKEKERFSSTIDRVGFDKLVELVL